MGEIIDEAIDHLETFKEKNNFLWLVFPDLHDAADEVFMNINGQVHTSTDRLKNNKGITSVQSTYDSAKIERYGAELKRIDLHIGLLLNYIKENYKEEDVLIIIHSDHGQGYFVENPQEFLVDERTKVPFMLLGDVQKLESDELMSNLDIYPTLLKILGIEHGQDKLHGQNIHDFGGSKREFVMTESYHPMQTYKAVIHSNDLIYYFETIDSVDAFGKVDLEKYKVSIDMKENITAEKLESEIERYTTWILQKRSILQK